MGAQESNCRKGLLRKYHKCVRVIKDDKSLVFGVDVNMDMAVMYSKQAIVGRVRQKTEFDLSFRMGKGILGEKIAYAPQISLLVKGWFVFILNSKVDVHPCYDQKMDTMF